MNIKVLLKIQKERLLVLLICQKNIEELLLERKKNRYHNLLNYGYSKLIGNLISLKHHYDKEKRLLKKVVFEEEWLNKFRENKEEKALYLIESLTIIENLNKEDLDYNNYLEELKEEIKACSCISQDLYLSFYMESFVKTLVFLHFPLYLL